MYKIIIYYVKALQGGTPERRKRKPGFALVLALEKKLKAIRNMISCSPSPGVISSSLSRLQ